MKKKLLLLASVSVLFMSMNSVYSKTTVSSDMANVIKLYKSGNYTECYTRLHNVIAKDSSNVLAYYYLAMTSAQVGKQDEAISNYEKVLTLAPRNSKLSKYASKGKTCLEEPEKCQDALFEDSLDAFVKSARSVKFSDEVKEDYERLKIENLMREMNRKKDIHPDKFKDYKDFSTMNNAVPTNDEIVAAIRVLQNAGMANIVGSPAQDLSFLNGNMSNNPMMNMMNGGHMSPQLIQAMLTNNMSLGF